MNGSFKIRYNLGRPPNLNLYKIYWRFSCVESEIFFATFLEIVSLYLAPHYIIGQSLEHKMGRNFKF